MAEVRPGEVEDGSLAETGRAACPTMKKQATLAFSRTRRPEAIDVLFIILRAPGLKVRPGEKFEAVNY